MRHLTRITVTRESIATVPTTCGCRLTCVTLMPRALFPQSPAVPASEGLARLPRSATTRGGSQHRGGACGGARAAYPATGARVHRGPGPTPRHRRRARRGSAKAMTTAFIPLESLSATGLSNGLSAAVAVAEADPAPVPAPWMHLVPGPKPLVFVVEGSRLYEISPELFAGLSAGHARTACGSFRKLCRRIRPSCGSFLQ